MDKKATGAPLVTVHVYRVDPGKEGFVETRPGWYSTAEVDRPRHYEHIGPFGPFPGERAAANFAHRSATVLANQAPPK